MKLRKLPLLLTLVLCAQLSVSGQKAPSKFGKVKAEDFSSFCPIDSGAHAHFIFDFGYAWFEYKESANGRGFHLKSKRHFRIQINDNQGFDWASGAVSLYESGARDHLISFKAYTYNLEDGKVVKNKFTKRDLLYEQTTKNWRQAKYALPNVKEGSIIEVEYLSETVFFFNLEDWYFQRDIPVLSSDFVVRIPEYFTYGQTQRGYIPFSTKAEYSRANMGTTGTSYNEQMFRYHADNVPAFPKEGFLRSRNNYLTRVEYELQLVQYPGRSPESYSTNWQKVDAQLMKDERFGKRIDKAAHLEELSAQLAASEGNALSKAAQAHSLISSAMSWNKGYGKYTSKSLSKSFKEGQGNVADINFNLLNLLRKAGVEAYPVVLSTQGHGMLFPNKPSLSSFNYVIVGLRHLDRFYLLDATDPVSGLDLIPNRCLNGEGRIIGSYPQKMINLMDRTKYASRKTFELRIMDDLSVKGQMRGSYAGYAAYKKRKSFRDVGNMEEFRDKRSKSLPKVSVDSVKVSGTESTARAMSEHFHFTSHSLVEDGGDELYISPHFDPDFDENPFKLEERGYPVEMDHPYQMNETYMVYFPEGYILAEMPEPIMVSLPNNAAKLMYTAKASQGVIMINLAVHINKTLFLPEEYTYLKQFFGMLIEKQEELLILRKSEVLATGVSQE